VCSSDLGVYRFPSLPPGKYVIETQLIGYKTAKRGDIVVQAGRSLAMDLQLEMGDFKEEVTVSGRAPIVSIVDNKVGANFDSEFIEDRPIPRNYYQVIRAAPGVNVDYTGSSGSAMLAYGGTSEGQNGFTIDGVNVADAAAGQHWVLPSIQWMEEIQIGGLGANAEYGGFTGGLINGVTKSGGNEFHGDVEYYYQPESWTSNNDPTGVQQTYKFSDFSASFGGPVVKDKLWFFVSAERWNQVTTPYKAPATSDRTIPRYLAKLTWQANEANRLMLMAEYDSVDNERRGISEFTLPDATSHQKAPGNMLALHWDSIISQSLFLNMKVTGYDGKDDYLPYHGTDLPGRYDYWNTEYEWQNQAIQQLNHRRIITYDGSATIYKNGLFGGTDTHAFKFGAIYEEGRSEDVWRRNGGFTYFDDSSNCPGEGDAQLANYYANPDCGGHEEGYSLIERGYGEYDEAPKYSGLAFYAQDSMRIGRFTVNPGIRQGSYDGGWQAGRGNPSVYKTTFWDPRIGVIWDVRGDERTAIKAHWGRYHDKVYTYMWDREASGKAVIPDQDCYWNPDTGAYDLCDPATVISARMGHVEQPYADETILTFEQALGKQMLIGVDVIDRRFRNIITMINANEDYTLSTDLGLPEITNPLTGQPLPVWILNSPPDFVLTTDNGAFRDFQSVVLRFDKRYANRWSGSASVVWTDLNGNILKNNGYAPEYEDRNGLTNGDGRMDYAYSKWEVKLNGTYDLPLGFQVGGQYVYYSGWYWTPYVQIRDIYSYAGGFNQSTGNNINLLPRGSEQFPGRNLLDLRIAWRHQFHRMALTAALESFNTLNDATVLDVYNRQSYCYLEDGSCSERSNYGDTYQIEAPRQIRASVRFSF